VPCDVCDEEGATVALLVAVADVVQPGVPGGVTVHTGVCDTQAPLLWEEVGLALAVADELGELLGEPDGEAEMEGACA